MRHHVDRLNAALDRHLPEKRLFLRSDFGTRFVRLRPVAQAGILVGAGAFFLWTLVATSIIAFNALGAQSAREQVARERQHFETRLAEMAAERDRRAVEAQAAHDRYAEAMDRVAVMQAMLLASERQRAELESGIEAVQRSLRERTRERDLARAQLVEYQRDDADADLRVAAARLKEFEQTLDFLMAALADTAHERETMSVMAETAHLQAQHLALEYRLIQDRNHRIFSQLEEAVEQAITPLERMFRNAGLPPERILQQVRAGHQTRTAALTPIAISTSGSLLDPDSDEARANSVLGALEEINTFRIAAQRTPFAMPVGSGVRMTSGFGNRRDPRTGRPRQHNGVDWAGPRGTPILSTGAGRVSFAGRRGGYGNLVIVQHDFGIETYYAHLHTIDVNVGQRVSRGDRLGGMGTTGRSTGVHLHYEIRIGGRPINPMSYIRAAQNVF